MTAPPSYAECSKAYPPENMPSPPGHTNPPVNMSSLSEPSNPGPPGYGPGRAPYGSQNPGVYFPPGGGVGYNVPPPPGSYAYPGPAPGFQPGSNPYGAPPVTNVIVMTQPLAAPSFQEYPIRTQCQSCRKEVLTQTEYVAGQASWLWCFVLALFGCILGCCVIPFFMPSCMDVEHKCPDCGQTIGKYRRSTSRRYSRARYYEDY